MSSNSIANAAGKYPAVIDTTPPSRQRSYIGNDGVNFYLIDAVMGAANLGIRAVVAQ